jgi:Ca2+-binding RTX toxin-like protein
VGDSLTYTATLENGDALPTWLTFDADTRTFSGTPDNSAVGTLSVRIVATDTSGATASDIFDIAVANTNDAPTLANAIADQTATEESLFSFQFDTNVFADVDAGDSLTYSARLSDGTSLPSWLAFNASTRTFTGTPGDSDTGTLEVEVTATDRSGASALALFSLDVTNVNDAPVAVGSRIRIDEDTTHSFNASDFGFTDIEGHGLQSIIISSLPGSGRLTLDGAVVTKGQRIDVEDISSLIWKPKAQESGDGYAKISYRVIDDGGTENGGVNRSANAATITFDVSEVVDYFIGGTGNQKLKGTVGTDVLDGGRGRDILTGGKGVDTFIFSTGYGRDTITDFQASGKAHDILDLSGLKSITDFRDLMKNHVQEFDGGVRINGGNGNILVLEDVKLKQLDAGDFLF